jgi:hypothetical protein
VLVPVAVPLPEIAPDPVPVAPVRGVGDRTGSQGSCTAAADCVVLCVELGALVAVVADEPDEAVASREPGWLAGAPVPARGPVSVAVFTGSFAEVVVPVELLARLVGDAASLTPCAEVPVVPTAPRDASSAVPARFVEPPVPVPAGPHGSVVLPMVLGAVVPVPCVDVVVVPLVTPVVSVALVRPPVDVVVCGWLVCDWPVEVPVDPVGLVFWAAIAATDNAANTTLLVIVANLLCTVPPAESIDSVR